MLRTAVLAGLLCTARASQKPLDTHPHSPFNDAFATYMDDILDRWRIPGLSLAVVDGDSVFSQGFGYATLPDVKATPDTMYFAGSTSKAQAAAALAHLIDGGNYSSLSQGWQTPIQSILRDDFVLKDEWATAHLTLDDAVSHRTGMPRHDRGMRVLHRDGGKFTIAENVRAMRHLDLSAPPRTAWQYCNYMYITLGHVVETLTGRWLGDVLRESLWGPLGMDSTFGDTEDAIAAAGYLATGYYWDEEKGEYVEAHVDSTKESGGAGLVISTVADYTKWVRCLIDQTAPLSKAAHKDIRTSRMLTTLGDREGMGEGDLTYGLGWNRKTHHGHVVYRHGGTEAAYSTQLYWIPSLRYAVVAMANTGLANQPEDEVVWRLIEDRLKVPQDERYQLTSSLKNLRDGLQKAKDNAIDDYYPDRPSEPVLPTLTTDEFAGTYYSPGYGPLNLTATTVAGQAALVADRTDTLFTYRLQLRHVTGNFWLADVVIDGLTRETWGAEFQMGVDGRPAGIEVRLTAPTERIDEGTVWFARE